MEVSIKEILSTKISVYENMRSTENQIMTVCDFFIKKSFQYKIFIENLRNMSDPELQKQTKQQLPCCVISGICGCDKKEENMLSKNNLIIIDIDEHDNPQLNSPEVLVNTGYRIINKLPFVAIVGRSCRGKGLFCIIPVNNIENIKQYIISLDKIFKEEIHINIDKQCSNINRLRFLSYDDLILRKEWISEHVEIFDIVQNEIENQTTNPKLKKYNTIISQKDLVLDDVFILKCIIKLVQDKKLIVRNYSEWLLCGFRLATLNQKIGSFLFLLISRNSPNYKNDNDVMRQYNICCKQTKFDRSCLAYYFGVAKNNYGKNWIEQIKEVEF